MVARCEARVSVPGAVAMGPFGCEHRVSTGSEPGYPSGQPDWGCGSDRIINLSGHSLAIAVLTQ